MKCQTLDVWKISSRLSAEVYKTISPAKDFGFRDQICRSGLSIPSNIAEGMEKESIRERIKFLDIAKGSTAEFITQVYIGRDIDFISREISNNWIQTAEHILCMLNKLQQTLKSQLPPKNDQSR
ncbi:four helix bundle protein [Chlorobium sp.]|jgi:four helix bundle protein|uniref:four helix bundle protein n=1 Tax=Chlorobium sp. TaxID=1095 RepID=UPI003C677E78|nr:four helix bundle protein [Chlorobiaceae bacterium]